MKFVETSCSENMEKSNDNNNNKTLNFKYDRQFKLNNKIY